MTELESGPEIYVEIGTGGLITVEVVGEGPAGPEGPPGEIGPQGDAFTYDDFTPEQLAALTGPQGADGSDGQDGVSPAVSIGTITGGHSVTITDADHPTGQTFNVMDGTDGQNGTDGSDGQDGAPGQDGADGVSPEVTITEITGGHTVTITDADHPAGQSFNVMDGEDGSPGQNGSDGQDGVSPEVSVSSITGGHSVTITDADHPTGQTFNVMDGTDGQDGADGQDGQDGDDGATFTPAVSAAGVISWTNDGGRQNPQSVDLVAAVLAALPTWQGGSY